MPFTEGEQQVAAACVGQCEDEVRCRIVVKLVLAIYQAVYLRQRWIIESDAEHLTRLAGHTAERVDLQSAGDEALVACALEEELPPTGVVDGRGFRFDVRDGCRLAPDLHGVASDMSQRSRVERPLSPAREPNHHNWGARH
jgi:hypothetical protein